MGRTQSRAERLKAMEAFLFRSPAGGRKVTEIVARFGVHRSTVYRDIRSLGAAEVPIWEKEGRFGVLKDRYLTAVRVRMHEALALYLSARLLSAHSDKHNPHVVSALEKLAGAMPEPVGEHIARTAAVADRRKRHDDYIRVLETLTRAWSERRQVRLTYHNPRTGETTERTVDPYFIEPSPIGYACYVIGYDHLRRDIREFKIERIQHAGILSSSYEIRASFDPYRYLAHSWGVMGGDDVVDVVLRFSARVAYRVRESDWPGVVDVTDAPDGGCRMRLRVKHTLEMKPWIRGWGPDCEVLEPEELRCEIAGEMKAAGAVYEG